ncbi:hypothetical protein V8G54_027407 [Vigna mungo]|uniref:Uncharacterized protein n=1 Tax=Vigna mungo TaxID=3915 RepID=A0AAQ3RQF3_VIGMU
MLPVPNMFSYHPKWDIYEPYFGCSRTIEWVENPHGKVSECSTKHGFCMDIGLETLEVPLLDPLLVGFFCRKIQPILTIIVATLRKVRACWIYCHRLGLFPFLEKQRPIAEIPPNRRRLELFFRMQIHERRVGLE